MTSRINVTAMMCEYANESGTQINNVFDTIKLGEDNKASFYIVMNVNTINYELNNFYFTPPNFENGQNLNNTFPSIFSNGIQPNLLQSAETLLLSPIANT